MRYPVFFLLALTACDQLNSDLDPVRLKLADPDSAKFDKIEKKGDVTCGLVNAKNRLGGYTGFKGFIVEAGKAEVEVNLGDLATRLPKACPRSFSLDYIDLLSGEIGAFDAMIERSKNNREVR
jgi:hypothetical protein